MWLWVLIIGLIGLGIYLAFTIRDIWRALKRLYSQVREFNSTISNFSSFEERAIEPIGDVYEDPSRLEDALLDRRRISQVRADARRRRLNEATGRWETMTDDSFDSIGPEERERARKYVEEFRS